MKKILIPTMPDDTHALYVKLALEEKGHSVTLWYTADYPEIQKHTFRLQDGHIDWCAKGLDLEIKNNSDFDVVWMRRPKKPIMPNYLHPDDVANAENENGEFFKTMWQVIAPNAIWVNPIASLRSVNSKLYQLKIASEIGLSIPESLFSNDPDEIRKFIRNYEKGEVIYKPIFPVYWVSEDALRLTYTNRISEELLPSDALLQSTPGIYQKRVEKSYELRITYFGEKAIAVKLNSQDHPKAKIDWRSVPCFEIGIEAYQLPDDIDEKCKEFMRRMNVKFGCFDFIVTPEGEYYFLEINEQGQFLWIEEANPSIKMLEAFTNYLIDCAGGDRGDEECPVSLLDFQDEVSAMLASAKAVHKDLGLFV